MRDPRYDPMNSSSYWNETPRMRAAMMKSYYGGQKPRRPDLPDSAELTRRAMSKGGPGNILTKAAEIGFEVLTTLSKKG